MNSRSLDQFRSAMEARGIIPPADPIADGKLHRCDVGGPGGRNDAAYVLHLDGIPAGGFQNHRDGRGWENWRADIGRPFSPVEEAAYRERCEHARRVREDDQKCRAANARKRAERIWRSALGVTRHPYLTRKQVGAHGIKEYKGRLIIPLRDEKGHLQTLQFVPPDLGGRKLYLRHGRKSGAYHSIGNGTPESVLYIAEGYATATTIHEVTGEPVAVAFDASNLSAVAVLLRKKFPAIDIVICGDDDHKNPSNPGRRKATQAAREVGGKVTFPRFREDRPDNATDFNDLFVIEGAEAVRRALAEAQRADRDDPEFEARKLPADCQGLKLISLVDRKPQPIEWIWRDFIPAGCLTLLFGRAEVGKTTLAMSIAATLSRGGAWPVTGEHANRCKVLILEAEDDQNRTLALLTASGADLENTPLIHPMVGEGPKRELLSISKHVELLELTVRSDPSIKLIIISPITAFIGVKDENSAAQIRSALAPLMDLAQRTGVTILGIAHPRKGIGGEVQDALSGSHVWNAAARSVLMAMEDPDEPGRRFFGAAKLNLTKARCVIPYEIQTAEISGADSSLVESSRIAWGDSFASETIREIFDRVAGSGRTGKTPTLDEWLRDFMCSGPRSLDEMVRAWEADGLPRRDESSFRKALARIGARTYRAHSGFGSPWIWSLDPTPSRNGPPRKIPTSEYAPAAEGWEEV